MPLQLSDLLDDHAETISKKAPDVTENLQQKAEEQADKVSKNARPYADQASGAIEGGAKRVAEGAYSPPAFTCSDDERNLGPLQRSQLACSPFALIFVSGKLLYRIISHLIPWKSAPQDPAVHLAGNLCACAAAAEVCLRAQQKTCCTGHLTGLLCSCKTFPTLRALTKGADVVAVCLRLTDSLLPAEAPKHADKLTSKAEEQAQKAADKAKPMAEDASKKVEGTAEDVAGKAQPAAEEASNKLHGKAK